MSDEAKRGVSNWKMNPYYNLPPEQRSLQRLVEQNNAAARLWRKLAPKRRARRRLLRHFLSREQLKQLDLEEFARAKPPQECIGQWITQ